jgi:hypothetical protein
MPKVTCVDALVFWGGTELPERNEASISWSNDVATAKTFVTGVSAAFQSKSPTWKDWSVQLNGYYDDSDSTIIDDSISGVTKQIVIYPTRSNMTHYWFGNAFLTDLDSTINTDDYCELNVKAEGTGTLMFI